MLDVRSAPALAGLALLTFALGADPASAGRVRGVTISTHTDGRDWALETMTPTMREIREVEGVAEQLSELVSPAE